MAHGSLFVLSVRGLGWGGGACHFFLEKVLGYMHN